MFLRRIALPLALLAAAPVSARTAPPPAISKSHEAAAARVRAYAPDVLVLSLGVDTFDGDPVGGFCLQTPDYLRLGQGIAGLGLPTLFVMEGGYAIEAVGINTVNVLEGFENA